MNNKLDKIDAFEELNSAKKHQNPKAAIPLFRAPIPTQSFPLDSLGELRPVVDELIKSVKAPPALCASSVLAAVSLVSQGHVNVKIDGRVIPTSEYFLTIGDSGERKTGVDDIVLEAVYAHERSLYEKYGFDLQKFELENDAYRTEKAKALKSELNSEAKSIERAPVPPLFPNLILQDFTTEGLHKMLPNSQPSMGLFCDEGATVFGGHAFQSENQLKTAGAMCRIWDAKSGRPLISKTRAGDGITVAYDRRISTHLMIQPIILEGILGNPVLMGQGLIARFLITHPETTVGTRSYCPIDLSTSQALTGFHSRVTEILRTQLPLRPDSRNELCPRVIILSEKAKLLWISFHDWVETEMGKGGAFEEVKAFGSKAPEHVLRLAGSLSAWGNLNVQEISIEQMEAAIELGQFYLKEALRLLTAAVANPVLQEAAELLAWMKQKACPVYLVQIYQFGPNRIREAKKARRVLAVLEEHGQIRRIERGMELDGSHRQEVWEVVQ